MAATKDTQKDEKFAPIKTKSNAIAVELLKYLAAGKDLQDRSFHGKFTYLFLSHIKFDAEHLKNQ